jgi:dihydrofolate reductase
MIVSLIVAVDINWGIGVRGNLPWRLSSDLQRFKKLTMGHHLIMGRKTYESIGKPLPGRTNIIVTRKPNYYPTGCEIASSLEEALRLAEKRGEQEVFVIGGGEVFKQIIHRADRIYLTRVITVLEADTYFPTLRAEEWEVVESSYHFADENNEFATTYTLLYRKQDSGLI